MLFLKRFFVLCFLFIITNANAYLDPGTGSLLLSSVVAIFASAVYFLKGFFYKITTGGGARKNFNFLKRRVNSTNCKNYDSQILQIAQNSITIYAEDKRYFSLFKPIVDAFENLNYPYTYYAGDEADPMLEFKSKIGHIECIGNSNKAYTKLNTLKADVCLITTPQLDVLQLKRSKGVKHYCHILHGLTHVDTYEIFALDYFDSVFVNSAIHTDFIREVETIRHLKSKQIQIIGCPYLDYLQNKLKSLKLESYDGNASKKPVILVAPSWGREALLAKYGIKLLKPLLDSGYEIIIRPHPQSYISEKQMLESLKAQSAHYTNLKWDNNIDNIYAMAESSLMIGDYSGVLFDYVVLFNKPIITMEFSFNIIGYDLEDTSQKIPWVQGALKEISTSISEDDFKDIKNIIDLNIKDSLKAQNREAMKENLWKFQGKGGEKTALELIKIHKQILEQSLGDELITHKQILAIDNLLQTIKA